MNNFLSRSNDILSKSRFQELISTIANHKRNKISYDESTRIIRKNFKLSENVLNKNDIHNLFRSFIKGYSWTKEQRYSELRNLITKEINMKKNTDHFIDPRPETEITLDSCLSKNDYCVKYAELHAHESNYSPEELSDIAKKLWDMKVSKLNFKVGKDNKNIKIVSGKIRKSNKKVRNGNGKYEWAAIIPSETTQNGQPLEVNFSGYNPKTDVKCIITEANERKIDKIISRKRVSAIIFENTVVYFNRPQIVVPFCKEKGYEIQKYNPLLGKKVNCSADQKAELYVCDMLNEQIKSLKLDNSIKAISINFDKNRFSETGKPYDIKITNKNGMVVEGGKIDVINKNLNKYRTQHLFLKESKRNTRNDVDWYVLVYDASRIVGCISSSAYWNSAKLKDYKKDETYSSWIVEYKLLQDSVKYIIDEIKDRNNLK